MAVAESQQMGTLLIGVEKVTYLTNRCRIYEILYLHDGQSEEAVANLESALIALYATMLRFLAHMIRLYEKGFGNRALSGVLNPDKLTSFVDECRELEARVDIEASMCERTLSRTVRARLDEREERLRQLLAGLQDPIMRVDSRMSDLCDILNHRGSLGPLSTTSTL
jgi:hypothetical protein